MAKQNHIFRKIRKGSQAEKLADVLIDRPATSAGRSYNTVSALAGAGIGLKIACAACGHARVHTSDRIVRAFGAKTELKDIEAACSDCKSTAVSVLPV